MIFNPLEYVPNAYGVYFVVAAVVVASGLPVVGLILVAEPVLMAATVLAAQGRVSVAVLLAITVVASVIGDALSYLLGRQYGPRLLAGNALRRFRGRVSKAHDMAQRRGTASVVKQRWVPPVRGFVPAVMGAARMPFRQFALSATIAAVLWAGPNVLAVYFAGAQLIAQIMLLLPLPITALLIVGIIRRRRAGRSAAGTRPTPSAITCKTSTYQPPASQTSTPQVPRRMPDAAAPLSTPLDASSPSSNHVP